ncbi:MAG: divalent-cation tolerance protein CutA [Pseudomonadota bacterium]
MTNCIIIITTTDTLARAKNIAHSIVEARLSKCVQISKINSVYEWEGKIEEGEEYRLFIKAPRCNEKAVCYKVVALHNYSLPQIVTLNIDGGSKPYLDWIEGM